MTIQKFLFVIFALTALSASAQHTTLKGKVIDSNTLEPLAFASVFINNTTIGVNADENGVFELSGIPEGPQVLICSYVGHKTQEIKLASVPANPIQIKLVQTELKEVEIAGTKDAIWNKQLKRFETLFLGPVNTSTCRILNPWVIDFTVGDHDVIIARASAPIEIENLNLGYNVIYFLRNFAASPESYTIAGNIFFKEIETSDENLRARWDQARLKTYQGSDRDLFRAIIKNELESAGFRIYEDRSSQLLRSGLFSKDLDKLLFAYDLNGKVSRSGKNFILKLPEKMEVHYVRGTAPAKYYSDIHHPISWLEIKGGSLIVNEKGVLQNPGNMLVSGYLSEIRIGQQLPYDYLPEISLSSAAAKKKPALSKLQQLAEQPYLHTDKSCYYPGETLWFKAYMNYATPAQMDSLSMVLYVDLIADGKVTSQKVLFLEDGLTHGEFSLSKNILPGDYFLRAYTKWMLNYGDEFVFIRPIKVLSPEQIVQPGSPELEQPGRGIILHPDKEKYKEQEVIKVSIHITDSLGIPVKGNLSVAVTDMKLTVPVTQEVNILSAFPMKKGNGEIVLRNDVEYGMSFTGSLLNAKGKPEKAEINVIEGKFEHVFTVSSDDNGKFRLKNLQFYDSVTLAFQAKGAGRKKRTIAIDSPVPKQISEPLHALNVETVKVPSQQYWVADNQVEDNSATVDLLPVTVEGSRTTQQEKNFLVTPDFIITSEWLRSANSNNLLTVLQSRVPGLRVVASMDTDGTVRYSIVLGPPSTWMDGDASLPLVLINQTPLGLESHDLTQYLMSINPNDVERIEVQKYGGSGYGARAGNGIIAIYMRGPHDVPEKKASTEFNPENFQAFTLRGFSSPAKFESPDHSQPRNTTKPDFRNTLYWNPQLVTDEAGNAEISFYASDLSATYRIVVEGVTIMGVPVRGVSGFEVGGQ